MPEENNNDQLIETLKWLKSEFAKIGIDIKDEVGGSRYKKLKIFLANLKKMYTVADLDIEADLAKLDE